MVGKIKYLIKLTLAYINRFKIVLLSGIAIGFAIFFLLSFFSPYIYTNTERVGITGRYTSDQLPQVILTKIGSGLTKVSNDGTVVPDLASWVIEDSGKTWVFHLDEDVYWQDGKKVSSDAISYNFSDVAIERPDDKTIKFKLNEVFAPFPSVVSRPIFKKGLLGTGEWEVAKVKVSGNFVSQLTLTNKSGQRLIYKFYPTTKHAILAFKLGQIDKLEGLLDKSDFNEWPNVLIEPTPNTNQIITIFFNTEDSFLSEKALRQALTYAINKESLGGIRAKSSTPFDNWAYNPQVKEYAYDQDHAKNLLSEMDKDRRAELKIRLTTSPDLLDEAEKISADWKAIGVDSSVQVSPVIPTEFQAFMTILDIPIDPDQYTLWHSTQEETNISKYKSPRIDKLLEEGRQEPDHEKRKQIYIDFQRFLLEDLPAAFLIYPNYYTVIRR